MKLAIIGATGLVGEEILKVLVERNINFNKLYLVASKESVGKTIHFCNVDYNIMSIDEVIMLFSSYVSSFVKSHTII